MIRSWLSSHVRVLVTATSSALVVALVAVAAIVSSGYTAQRLDLDAASVWVSNAARAFVGRANTQVFELDTVVASPGQDTEIVQSGGTVLLVDGAEATVGILDPATASVLETIALPPDRPRVFLAGGTVVVYSEGTGELWSMPVAVSSSIRRGRVSSGRCRSPPCATSTRRPPRASTWARGRS